MIINSIDDIVKGKGLEKPEQLEHYVYKYTDCGAWITWDDNSVIIGSIVEGSNAEFSERFLFPVESETLDAWVTELERLCDEAWHEANDDEVEHDARSGTRASSSTHSFSQSDGGFLLPVMRQFWSQAQTR